MGPDQWTARGEQSLCIFIFAKDVFHESELKHSNYNTWILARQSWTEWLTSHICSVPSPQDLFSG